VALGLAVRAFTQRTLRRRLQFLEMQNAVESERSRIAKDIHDDLGARLTQITLLSELGKTSAADPAKSEQHFDKIAGKARGVVQALDEIVWAVNPKNDNLVRLVDYICRFADECFESTAIRCWQEIPSSLPALPVRAEVRHNCFLATKEALHNVLKHSGASEVWLRVALEDQTLRLEIEDNGHGFVVAGADFTRSGLKNMKARTEEIGGAMDLRSTPPRGTRVQFTLRLEAAAADAPGHPPSMR
jgi:signal transduction histidine kinase